MHIWAALTCAGACMGRHVKLPLGIGDVYANMYTILVGPPATKKSSAAKFARDLVLKVCDVPLAPDDTSGRRQGLITAFERASESLRMDKAINQADALSTLDAVSNYVPQVSHADRHVLFAIATELDSFLGQNSADLAGFLIKAWDGDPYRYQLSNEEKVLPETLLSLLGCSTPTDLARILPTESIGQGFTSRIIFVFANKKEKRVPPSVARVDRGYAKTLQDVYKFLWFDMRDDMKLSPEAGNFLDFIYDSPTKIQDTRFVYYVERRHTHLIKVAMILAATRKSYTIELEDMHQAKAILEETEKYMPDALGEFGLSPLAAAKQRLLEFLQHAGQPVTETVLWMLMQRDMKLVDFKTTINAFINTGKIRALNSKSVGTAYMFNDELSTALRDLSEEDIDLLFEETDGRKIEKKKPVKKLPASKESATTAKVLKLL